MLKGMRPAGTYIQLQARCKRAMDLRASGQTPTNVAKVVGAERRTIYRWMSEQTKPRSKRPRLPVGRPCRLNALQLRRLERELKRGAFEQGYAGDYWTLDRIAHLIWDLFEVRYHPSSVWHILNRMGWSCQQPQRQALQRNDEKIAHWRHYIWPQIKKVS
jgi:transposase